MDLRGETFDSCFSSAWAGPCAAHSQPAAASFAGPELTGEAAGLSQQEGAPGHEEDEPCLQQREAAQLGELSHVTIGLKVPQQPQWDFTRRA